MLNKLLSQIRKFDMLEPGDRVICAVSGGADSMALLWAMYLLKDKLQIALEAAHFNHGLRGAESDRDEAFVQAFCRDYDIVCHVGRAEVKPGKKGLEAAARDARYAFLRSLDGVIATAHTADDNAETLLLHLVRGTGLKGLGGITSVGDNLIRPMLSTTREDVLAFLEEYHISYVEDSSNGTDAFLRNRLRHTVMPILKQENPRLVQNMSAMAMELREDEDFLWNNTIAPTQVDVLQKMHPALRRRALSEILKKAGVREPERSHITLAENLVFSDKPSAYADFPGNVRLRRSYDRLLKIESQCSLEEKELAVPGTQVIDELGLLVSAAVADEARQDMLCFTVQPKGKVVIRSRQAGDQMRLPGGTKSLKKLFIDRKIPAYIRLRIPVVADDLGVLGVYGVGPNLDRIADHGIRICFETK